MSMIRRFLILGLAIAGLVFVASQAVAVPLHNFECKNCHGAGLSLYAVAGSGSSMNLCLQCHTDAPPSVLMQDARDLMSASSKFNVNDLSNAMGTHEALSPSVQSSHSWANANAQVRDAGASPATTALYKTRYMASANKVTCSVCHNPHAEYSGTSGPGFNTALRLDNSADAVCLDCHRNWDTSNATAGAFMTHPIGMDLTNVNGTSVKAGSTDPNVQLVNGVVSCSSCHGLHWTDSNAATTDGRGGNHGIGDGKLLVTDGRVAGDAAKSSALCQSCHTHKVHGSGQVGCLDCHGGHSYNGGSPNWYVLRDDISNVLNMVTSGDGSLAMGDVSGLRYNFKNSMWMNGGNGYCEGCHELGNSHNGLTYGAKLDGSGNPQCSSCHNHDDATASFTGVCNACHGFAPSSNTQGTDGFGYAYAMIDVNKDGTLETQADYSLPANNPKNEATTPHLNHSDPLDEAAARGNHNFGCTECHAELALKHKNNQFQDVDFDTVATTGGVTPGYTNTGDGSCATVYCHSNGRTDVATGSRNLTSPSWQNGKRSQASTQCTICHGNDAATMTTAGNSTAHNTHLTRYGASCELCHFDTATDNTTLKRIDGKVVAEHVNGDKNVLFNSTYDLGADVLGSTNTYSDSNDCSSVYCHSNGSGNYPFPSPTWNDIDDAGRCGACHQVLTADSNVNTIAGPILGGSHAKHVFNADGPQLTCTTCHTNNGTGNDHVNGAPSMVPSYMTLVCNQCHGIEAGDPGLSWGDPDTAGCETCHAGSALSVIGGNTAPVKNDFFATGHGETGLGGPDCKGCHDSNATGHLDVTKGDLRLTADPDGDGTSHAYATNASLWCQECHVENAHFDDTHISAGTSTDGDTCTICHEPHGEGMGSNSDAMLIVGQNFTDRDAAGSYWNTSGTGVCQVCHDAASTPYYYSSAAPYFQDTSPADGTPDHNSGASCISCHDHMTVPGFKPSCGGCHGDKNTGQFWPTGAAGTQIPSANDEPGRHQKHMEEMAMRLYGETAVGNADNDILANYTSNNPGLASDQKQIALCEYCHAATINDSDHAVASRAEVFIDSGGSRHAKAMWGANDLDAAYDPGNNTCSAVDCHHNTTTAAGTYGWYDAGTSTCQMCHTVDPTTDPTHSTHMGMTGEFGRSVDCDTCHRSFTWGSTAPSIGHINGTWTIVSATYNGNSVNKVAGTCGTNQCHNDGTGTGLPMRSNYNWGNTLPNDCASCHSDSPTADKHTEHLGNDAYIPGVGVAQCDNCHTLASSAFHLNGSPTMTNKITNMDSGVASCTSVCHVSANGDWLPTGELICLDCHGTGLTLDASNNPPSSNAHPMHTGTEQEFDYGDTARNNPIATEYRFGCGNCHGTDINLHVNGTVNVVGNGWNGTTCDATYCHSDGLESGYTTRTTPAWTSSYAAIGGDRCAKCHGNGPGTDAHAAHETGFHYDAIYSGRVGFLPVGDPVSGLDPSSFAPASYDKGVHRGMWDNTLNGGTFVDTMRGHGGGTIADGTHTSTVMNCNVCHSGTVTVPYNAEHTNPSTVHKGCGECHAPIENPSQADIDAGNVAIELSNRANHVNGQRDVSFFNERVRSKAQVHNQLPFNEELPADELNPWTDVEELQVNWTRINPNASTGTPLNGYKPEDGNSYDEQPDTLANMAAKWGGWNAADKTCMISCHLWMPDRVDKIPAKWDGGPIICIDCHTRLPK